jgi:FkbM family methyltransferase
MVYRHGEFALDDLRWALNALGNPHRGGLFVDVGANIGTTTIPVLLDGAQRGIAFEPVRSNFALLTANVILNGLDDRVALHRVAVSDSRGTAEMELSPHNQGDHRLRVATTALGRMGETEWTRELVEVVRLDDALSGERPAVVWVDTQGHEPFVMSGAPSLLASGVPFVIEFWPYGLRRSGGFERLEEIVADAGRVVDVRASIQAGADVVITDLRSLAQQLGGVQDHTDLIVTN